MPFSIPIASLFPEKVEKEKKIPHKEPHFSGEQKIMDYKDILHRVLSVTNNGLDIICEECPAAAEVVNTPKKKFRLRSEERTPSAELVPPKNDNGWHIRDYGMEGRDGYFSPIDLYMWNRGWGKEKFSIALQELAERYGVQDELKTGVNMPVIEQRTATPEEQQRKAWLDLFEGFGGIDLSTWLPFVKPEHLTQLNWHAVKAVYSVKGDKLTIRQSTPTYPIFAKKCPYCDAEGRELFFWKVYEPLNPDKAFRFRIVGDKQPDYIYGLAELIRAYHQNNDEKLSEVLLVSGCSDAVSALAMGCQPIWLDSETRQLTDSQFYQLQKYAKRVINIPDIDSTGKRMGISLALAIPSLHTAWLTQADFYGLHDNRGRLCKDLRDYLRLNPTRKAMEKLLGRARQAQFWTEHTNDKGITSYSISGDSLAYFLGLKGYSTLKDDTLNEPQYIRTEGYVVTRVKAKSIVMFLKQWCDHEGLPEALVNKIMTSRLLPTNAVSRLAERDDLDFSSATATSQLFYFRNGAVLVTADKLTRLQPSLSACGHYVWGNAVIQHDYRDMKPQFTVTKDDDGNLHITITPDAKSKLLRFLVNTSRLYWRKVDEQGIELTPGEVAEEERSLIVKILNIGYMLHRYKSSSEAKATLCLDHAMSDRDDACNGRSGKSFYINALTQMLVNYYEIDGRTLDSKTNMQFIYAGLDESTSIIKVDECSKNFNFEYFFGQISNNITVEKKGKDPVCIPFSIAPKFIFGTNYVLKKHDPSTDARIWPVIFSDYYHEKTDQNDYRETRTIRDDFKQQLMRDEDYSETDWQSDLHLMLECLQLYLSLPVGERQLMPPMQRIQQREIQASIYKNFRQWADENLGEGSEWLDRKVRSDELLSVYNQDTFDKYSPKTFTEQLKKWCQYAKHIHCYNPASCTGQKNDGDRWQVREGDKRVNYYYIQTKAAAEAANKPEAPQADLFKTTEEAPF